MENLAVKLTNIEKNYGAKCILSIDELTIYQNERIAIIGKNGSGKSTLLKLIAGKVDPDRGKVQREIEFNYYAQSEEITNIQVSEQLDGELLSRFSVPITGMETLSGGEQAKFRLTNQLSDYQMGLLLDEPTTHLDSQSIGMLIKELNYYYGTLVVVSHDRFFMNQIATKIWEVEEGRVREFNGNYAEYVEQKEAERIEKERLADHFQKEKKRLENAIIKKQAQAKKLTQTIKKQKQKNQRPDRLASSKQKDTVQKSLQKTAKAMTSRLEQLTEQTGEVKNQKIIFPTPKTLEIHHRFPIMGDRIALEVAGKKLLEETTFQFGLGEKIAITGANGSGKSTLLRYIIDQKQGITVSSKVVFSVYQQMDYQLTSEETLLAYLLKQTEYPEPFVRALLNNLGFKQTEISKSVRDLSGGEATRLAIALLFAKPANTLILDEPTNFIDINTMEALEQLIKQYPGTVLFTSHDTLFVREVAEVVYQIEDQKLVLKT
ncbi:ribosomal protection-like ABC-F family protein [Candidatus Enterococcus courvalinii]|uniref:ABC-F type ribosomal protection protein n=1 Tax=Candidatus Enterococcus courvalinii TaxID=2815329 RepID=A0ABS3HXL6_9ENTE|nr:ABC-F type ribosomal protection protein [Enterococcus sp. MSG2901]MBO0481207.1 ABC-F type ribosomal protection protein [Enterococcus sp. MSG2901]